MKLKHLSKYIVSGVMAFALIALPVFIPLQNAYAAGNFAGGATTGWNNQSGAFNNGSGPYSMNMSNIMSSGVLTAVIGCTGIVSLVQTKINKLFGIGTDKVTQTAQAAADVTKVPVTDSSTQTNINTAKQDLTANQKSDSTREECLNGVAFAFAKMELAYITQKTVNWINSGFGGDPLYVRNQESFFQNVKRDQLQMLMGPYVNPANSSIYPFGQALGRALILSERNSIDNKLKSDLLYSLKPGSTINNYSGDFSRGGWLGWLVLTQNPVNNPLGFTMTATGYIAGSVAAKQTAQTNELNQCVINEAK